MNLKKNINKSKEIKSSNKIKNKNNVYDLDTPAKMYEYQSRIKIINKKINQKVKEEQKNIEKYLSKITTNFHSMTSRNFYRDYKKYSEKYFHTTNLVDDIAEKYQEKGYIIPNFHHDFFKVNPLLDCNVNKLFISYLFNRNGEKIDYHKIYNQMKSVKYIKKLKKIVDPELSEEKEDKYDKYDKDKKTKKKKIKLKNKKARSKKEKDNKNKKFSEGGLTLSRNINKLNNNNLNSNKKNNSSKTIIFQHLKGVHNERYNKTRISFFNKNEKSRFNRSKSINNSSMHFKIERKNNRHESHDLRKNSLLLLNLKSDLKNTISSSKNLILLNTNSTLNNTKNSSNINSQYYLKTEKKVNNKIEGYLLDTPQNKYKNIISSHDKSSKNTKPYSSANNEGNDSLNQRTQSSRVKMSLLPFKIKEFSVNSKRDNSISKSRKNVIVDYNFKHTSYPKIKRYSHRCSTSRNQNNLIDNKIKNAIISSSTRNKKSLLEEKDRYINIIYKELKAGKYEDIEDKMKYYLKSKKMGENEINYLLKKYEYKNLNSNFQELKKLINENNLSKKIERIYLNNHDFNRIEPLMNAFNKKDKEIFLFENKISNIYNKS